MYDVRRDANVAINTVYIYIYILIHVLLKGIPLFYHITHNDGMHMSLEIYQNRKNEACL